MQGVAPATPPTFVPTQVVDPNYAALQKALETLGAQGPQQSQWVKRVYGFARQLVDQTQGTTHG